MLSKRLSLKAYFDFSPTLVILPRSVAVMLVGWVLTMISLPIVKYFYGEGGVHWGVVAGVLLQVVTVLLILHHAWGIRRTVWVAGMVVVLAWGVEAIGSSTGFPFGTYHYTDKLQPHLAHVPWLIPLAWLMMLPPAWAVADRLTGSTRGLTYVGLSALAFTVWDLFLDPQMVAWGLWLWDDPGGYFGIPWTNYLGWLLAAALITVVVRPQKLPVYPLLIIYTVTWVLETIGLLVFWGLAGPALVGFVAMGSLVGLAWSLRGERMV